MTKPKVFVTRKIHDSAMAMMKDHYNVQSWDSEDVIPKDKLLASVKDSAAIFCTISDVIDADVLNAAGSCLKTVATMSVGTHHIDVSECKKRGIYISTTADVSSDSAAELTVCLLLVTARRCLEGVEAVNKGEWGLWKPMWICGVEFSGRTLGILGFGRVGFGVARRMKPFGLSRILYNDVYRASMGDDLDAEFVTRETLFKESDFLVITVPLNGSTKNLINSEVFAKMKSTAILINTSRGPIVNTDDLVQALSSGKIAAAGLDVTDPQPLPPSHPLVNMPNCVITPHLGTNSVQAREAMATYTAKNIVHILHKPIARVKTKEVFERNTMGMALFHVTDVLAMVKSKGRANSGLKITTAKSSTTGYIDPLD